MIDSQDHGVGVEVRPGVFEQRAARKQHADPNVAKEPVVAFADDLVLGGLLVDGCHDTQVGFGVMLHAVVGVGEHVDCADHAVHAAEMIGMGVTVDGEVQRCDASFSQERFDGRALGAGVYEHRHARTVSDQDAVALTDREGFHLELASVGGGHE